MSQFFEFAEKHKLALFPLPRGTKIPTGIVANWTEDCSTDSAQWRQWQTAHAPNFGVVAEASNLLIVDIDASRVGRDKAWDAWCSLSAEWGLPGPLMPQCHTAREGWHVYLRLPADVETNSLRHTATLVRDDDGHEIIGVKVRHGFTVAPGSEFEKRPYQLDENAPPPHPAPAGLIEAVRCHEGAANSQTKGEYDPASVAALVSFLAEHDEFNTYESWIGCGMALKLACGDAGLDIWRSATWPEAQNQVEGKWKGFAGEARPGAITIASLMKRAHSIGWKGICQRTSASMFGNLASTTPPEIAQSNQHLTTTPHNGIPMLGRGEIEFIPADADESLTAVFTKKHSDNLRYVAAWGKWLEWDGARWRFDDTLRAYDLARAVCRDIANVIDPRAGKQIASARTVAAVERMAKADRSIAATIDQWDADPWLLNTPGGIVDLRTGEMRPTIADDYVTKSTAVAPGGSCPTWLSFLYRVTAGDTDLMRFLQFSLGYALTGATREHALFFLYGTGANGKSVLLSTIAGILGDYHTTAPIETFTASATERHPTDLAGLRGARLVTATETEEGRRWAESKIKALTGGDKISARFMRQDFFEFVPTFKLMIAGNHKPGLRSVDEAIRRRIHLVPFTVTIPPNERDHALSEKLKAEWPGILAWLIEGCRKWQSGGLQPPKAVRDATTAYLDSEDALGAWIDERCERESTAWTAREQLFASWSSWAAGAGEFVGSSRKFLSALETRGFEDGRRNNTRGFRGIKLRQPEIPSQCP